VEENMTIDEETGKITAAYPWKPCVRRLVNNRWQAEKILKNIETKIKEQGTYRGFQDERERHNSLSAQD
jgi:hypothetical protein